MPINEKYAGLTYGYNKPLVANRVHDILTAIAFVKNHDKTKKVHLVGLESAGPWALLARALCGDAVARTAVDVNQFRFENTTKTNEEMMLPGAVKYGGLASFAALCAPHDLFVFNHPGTPAGKLVQSAYEAVDAKDHLERHKDKMSQEKIVEWLLR